MTCHIEDLSLCGLFMMDISKKIGREFAAHRTTAHTTLDACKDITKLSNHLLEKGVVQQRKERNSPAFVDPTDAGLDKLCNSTWIRDTLDRVEVEDLEREEREDYDALDLNYELSHVV